MYIPTGCFLQLLHSILLHNGKAPTFALIICEDSVLFVEFHFISVHFGAGLIFLSCAVQEFRVRRSRISSFKPLYPDCQLPTTSPTGPGLSKPFFLVELLWILPGPSADAFALKSESGLPDTSWCPKTIFPAWRGPMSSPPPCYTQSLSCKKVKPRKWRHPQLPCLLYLPTFGHGAGCAEKAHGDQYREHSCAGMDAEGSEGGDAYRLKDKQELSGLEKRRHLSGYWIFEMFEPTQSQCVYI